MKFRFKAMQAMRAPDELDSVTSLARPRGWLTVLVILAVIAGAGAWAFTGTLPYTVRGDGLLTRPLGVAPLESTHTGQVRNVHVRPGDEVAEGQAVADVVTPGGRVERLRSPFPGMVVDVTTGQGQALTPGETVATIERSDAPDDRLVAMLFVPDSQAASIVTGHDVDLDVSTAPAVLHGLLAGRVTSVSPYPLSASAIAGLLGDAEAAKSYVAGGPVRLVLVDLTQRDGTPTGYAWSSREGPPGVLRTQIQVSATVRLGGKSPISFVLGR
ncbi:HlyD family efflux transporter periplasmic adaptor subunit [Nonomuraea sp. LPB2021202275-12-8]|uniref:HlyD family efflux transporter periplasmic adaptor subunit n=1 Tax=Nonomuraea sp. LPB2021202275-12-8 TaxID=3120159 RepID=UPI00300D79EF